MLYDVLIFDGGSIFDADNVVRINDVGQEDMETLVGLLASSDLNISLIPFREEEHGDVH